MSSSPLLPVLRTLRYTVFDGDTVAGAPILRNSSKKQAVVPTAGVSTSTLTKHLAAAAPPHLSGDASSAYPPTDRLYMLDTYLMSAEAKVLGVVEDVKHGHGVIFDRTIFHPQGGGQPSDEGVIKGSSWSMEVVMARDVGGVIHHYGNFSGESPLVGETVSLALDTAKRILHAVLHSAGHAIDKAMKMVVGDSVFVPLKGYHFVDSPYVEYQGILPGGLEKHAFIEQLNKELESLVEANIATVIDVKGQGNEISQGASKHCAGTRIATVAGLACPCGGTHVRSTSQLAGTRVTKVKAKKGTLRVSYTLARSTGG